MQNVYPYQYDHMNMHYSCAFRIDSQAGNSDFHMHNLYEIYMLISGEIHYFVEQSCYHMTSGSLILFHDKEIHKATNLSDAPFERVTIHIDPAFIHPYCTAQTNLLACFHRKTGQSNLVFLSEEEQKQFLYLAKILSQASKDGNYGQDILALSVLLQILLLVNKAYFRGSSASNSGPMPHRVQTLMNYVDNHLTEALSLDSISKALSLDKYYLSHLFKSETGSSIFQYILVKRIALAKELLTKGYTVTESCHIAGFNDYSNFIRSFRQITGYTPGQFKKEASKGIAL
ncbi:MAG: AraC family transcriptional regulator [bacterium]|nr:AraC family transcriptional regulator [bacterium]